MVSSQYLRLEVHRCSHLSANRHPARNGNAQGSRTMRAALEPQQELSLLCSELHLLPSCLHPPTAWQTPRGTASPRAQPGPGLSRAIQAAKTDPRDTGDSPGCFPPASPGRCPSKGLATQTRPSNCPREGFCPVPPRGHRIMREPAGRQRPGRRMRKRMSPTSPFRLRRPGGTGDPRCGDPGAPCDSGHDGECAPRLVRSSRLLCC